MSRINGFIRLVRPVNGLMISLAVLVGASLALAEPFSAAVALKLLLGFVTAFTLSGASMAVNDYYDREIDVINEPSRPIPSGLVKPKEGLAFAVTLTAIGLAASAFTNLLALAVAASSLAVSVTYATKGKRTGLPGNFLVSACVAIPFIYGSLVVDQSLSLRAVLYAALAFLANTGREVTKGIVDVEGDKAKGMKTVAASRGEKIASYIASAFFFSAVLLSLLPPFLGLATSWYVPFVIVADLGFAASSVNLVHDPSRQNAKRTKNLVMAWMLLSMTAFFAGGL
jgi:geranylgeranylglycerol-phosphate geranylgeranyltransferase